jgi:Ca2+-binding RTX toxin-like protein
MAKLMEVRTASYSKSTIAVFMSQPGAFSAAGWTFANVRGFTLEFVNVEIFGSNGADTITGSSFDDLLVGGNLGDVLNGGQGSDTASYVSAPAGADGVTGINVVMTDTSLNTGHATGDSYDSIENLVGSQFQDFLSGDNEANSISGLNGIDTLLGQGGADKLFGGNGDDILFGGTEGDTLEGGEDDDTLLGGLGDDILRGGNGTDTASYAFAAGANGLGVTVDIVNRNSNTREADGDSYNSIENLRGSDFNDILRGDNLANTINGGFGDDTLVGREGDDVLNGGNTILFFGSSGDDILEGGLGADVLNGGDGVSIDTASYANAAEFLRGRGVTARLLNPSLNIG